MDTRDISRFYMKTASTAVGAIADYNLKSMKLAGASALRSFEYLSQLAGAKTGMEAIEVSGAHYRNQLSALGDRTDDLVDFARKMRMMCLDSAKREGSS